MIIWREMAKIAETADNGPTSSATRIVHTNLSRRTPYLPQASAKDLAAFPQQFNTINTDRLLSMPPAMFRSGQITLAMIGMAPTDFSVRST